jgi:PAS domain S-box-containing protein
VHAVVPRGPRVVGPLMSSLGAEEITGLGFEQVVRHAPVAIVVIDASGRVIHSNGRARELTGRQLGREMPADLDGAIDIFHPDGRRYERREWPAVRSLASGEEIVEEEFFYAVDEGARLWIRCSCCPVRDEDGEIVAAVLAMTDVTEHKGQKERLTHLAGLLDNTEDAVVALDERYFITVWNRGAERLYGWRAEEAVGLHANEVARTNLSEEERAELRRDLATSGRWRGEVTVARKDGSTAEAELISVALRGERRDITGYLTIHRDISGRRRAMQELREARRRVETILESITDEFVAVDRDWRYTYVNDRTLSRIRGSKGAALTREDVIGRSMWELFPDAVGTEVERRLRAAMGARDPVEFELYVPVVDQWLEVHVHPSDSGLAIYYRDVTARRRSEAALRAAQRQSADADRRLDEVRQAERSRIARDLHDGALQTLTHALAVTGRHAAGRDDELFAILQQVGGRLRSAIYDLRLEQDGERPFSDALRDLVEVNRETAPVGQVILETDDALPSGSFGDRGVEVLHIIGEALTNACRHAGAERIVVRVAGPATRLTVEVTDDGGGFDADRPPSALHGQGLRGMHERARLLDADLDVRSDRTGTTVRLQAALTGP